MEDIMEDHRRGHFRSMRLSTAILLVVIAALLIAFAIQTRRLAVLTDQAARRQEALRYLELKAAEVEAQAVSAGLEKSPSIVPDAKHASAR
jgi:sensor histidine kinase regulating citrate/malate metabolism